MTCLGRCRITPHHHLDAVTACLATCLNRLDANGCASTRARGARAELRRMHIRLAAQHGDQLADPQGDGQLLRLLGRTSRVMVE